MKAKLGRCAAPVVRCCAVAALAAAATSVQAQELPAPKQESFNLRGMTGLIDMPSARSQPDAQISITGSTFGGFTHTTLHFQALPWLEGSFRYSITNDFFADRSTLYDRSFDLKLLVSEEGRFAPAVAVGLQDFLGTGVMSGEYIVGTKAVLPNVNVTAGVGWGRFAGMNGVTNPLTKVSDRFRDRGDANTTGTVSVGNFFRGEDVAFFGGVEWSPTFAPGLRLKAEYSSDDYSRERRFSSYEQRMPFNFGVEYQVISGVTLGGYAMYGTDYGLRLTFSGNPRRPLYPQDFTVGPTPLAPRSAMPLGLAPALGEVVERIGEGPASGSDAAVGVVTLDAVTEGARWADARTALAPGAACPVDAALDIDAALGVVDGVTFRDAAGAPLCSVVLRPAGRAHVTASRLPAPEPDIGWHADVDRRAAIARRVRAQLRANFVGFESLDLQPRVARLEVSNGAFSAAPQAIGRAARALASEMPASVEVFEITVVEGTIPAVTVVLQRTRLEEAAELPDRTRRSWLDASVIDAPASESPIAAVRDESYPRFGWFLSPAVPISIFDPDQPLRADLTLRAGGTVEVGRGMSLNAGVSKRVIGQLDEITRVSDSKLPRVRSDIGLYLREGDPSLDRLTADYLFKPAPAVFGRVSVGLLESMFGGISGEVLWKPVAQNWGLGAELNYVRQRSYEKRFEFFDYSVATGHGSFYWDTGWNDYEIQVDAGRYLAGDWGGTFTLSRRLPNGWEVGGFFTLTDVPFDQFGEGSFDKGLLLTIPLRWGLPLETRSRFATAIRPLTRDGGARLSVAGRLYPVVRELDESHLHGKWGAFWK